VHSCATSDRTHCAYMFFLRALILSRRVDVWWELLMKPKQQRDIAQNDCDMNDGASIAEIGIQFLSPLAPPPSSLSTATSHFVADLPQSREAEA
jgi:hypothetical protein